ncbi:MAG: lytic transglycosylase domain-containing protein [Deltaproteobacteria bacterium]|nr:lytic transglycosylase domain-containing protein [Deltaproteobacteria bacterium]
MSRIAKVMGVALGGWLLASVGARAHAREVRVPILFDHALLRQRLVQQVYTEPGESMHAWQDEDDCNTLVLSEPRLATVDGRLQLKSKAAARAATPIFGWCLFSLEWSGTLEVLEEPVIDPQAPVVRFEVVDSNIYDAQGEKGIAGKLWDLAKETVAPRLAGVTFDLRGALHELGEVLTTVLPDDDAAWTRAVADSVRLAAIDPEDGGVRAVLAFDLPPRAPAPDSALPAEGEAEPALTPEELARWERSWQQWDAFFTYIIKRIALDADPARAEELRAELFAVLVDARLDLLVALAPTAPGQPDPVRALFVKSWQRLTPVLRDLEPSLPGQAGLTYLSFIAAGDALAALDELGDESPLELSADGLRRMARIVGPRDEGDPLVYTTEIDPQLRELFGFGAPIEPPDDYPDEGPIARLLGLVVGTAWAADGPDSALGKKLHQWVPSPEDVSQYLPLVRELLVQIGGRTLDAAKLDRPFAEVYKRAVLATAWQESCWRQWVKENGRIRPIQSAVGSVGLVQINKNVWRGVYDLKGLTNDVAYNARAGTEILIHYLRDYAVKKGEHSATGNVDNLARSTYAIYNGGPGHLRRYRDPKERADLKKIDALFWAKYQAVKAGRELDVAQCLGGSPAE